MTTDGDPFANAPTAGSIWAFLYSEHGEIALRQTLALVIDGTATDGVCFTREEFERDVSELNAIGLDRVAAIVQEVTETVPTEVDRIIQQHRGSKANLKSELAQLRDIDLSSLQGKVDDDVIQFLTGYDPVVPVVN